QIFANLLTNAAKYTDAGGNISVVATDEGAERVVRVSDDGIGVDPELLPRIFEPFTQGARGIDRLQGGLGLGLPLVRSLVELHGGAVNVASDGPGRGTSVEVRLPASAAEPTTASPAPRAVQRPQGQRLLLV
ncbi:MAG TPA: hybrid sensor histidine kinase/response regulator, partial [Myxococcales bacterium]|nr:hybrid sensor histidine kinase/response regulator [Myxococcales bacterium]